MVIKTQSPYSTHSSTKKKEREGTGNVLTPLIVPTDVPNEILYRLRIM